VTLRVHAEPPEYKGYARATLSSAAEMHSGFGRAQRCAMRRNAPTTRPTTVLIPARCLQHDSKGTRAKRRRSGEWPTVGLRARRTFV
jgi:hypothetical protein